MMPVVHTSNDTSDKSVPASPHRVARRVATVLGRRTQLLALAAALLAPLVSAAQIPGHDRRHTEIRHTDRRYAMPSYARAEWEERAAFLRKQVLFSAGLWPLPEKTPLNPRSGEPVVHDDYAVSAVLLETYPGFFLGGNLYRPAGKPGPFPAGVSPHGHWRYGRFENSEFNSVPARAISLARQGHVVFAYDMVGWNDTRQAPHGFAGPREHLWLIGCENAPRRLRSATPTRCCRPGPASGSGWGCRFSPSLPHRAAWSRNIGRTGRCCSAGREPATGFRRGSSMAAWTPKKVGRQALRPVRVRAREPWRASS